MRETYKGKYRVRNPEKYKGDPTNVIYRSSWEKKLMNFLDNNKNVISWCSEEIVIPYVSPIDGKPHRYFPDFLVKRKDRNGTIGTILIEVKPEVQTRPPKPQSRKTKRYINEVMEWGRNEAKWKAAANYSKKRGWEFKILTEKDLGI